MAGELNRWGAGGEARIEEPKRREGGWMGGELENCNARTIMMNNKLIREV